MDTAQWPQGIGVVKPMESSSSKPMLEKKARPQKDQNLNCPRCNSTNTKFCYYNNYSLTQPRYFCKTCRRYWTEGGSLRNVPVGGGSRKNKRSSPSSSSSPSQAPSKKIQDFNSLSFPIQSPRDVNSHEGMQDLNIAYPPPTTTPDHHHHHDLNSIAKLVEAPFSTIIDDNVNKGQDTYSSGVASTSSITRGLSSFMMPISDSNTLFSVGFPMQEFKPSLNFSLDGFDNGYGSLQGVHETHAARMLFPVEDMKPNPSSGEGDDQDRGQGESNGFWNGVLGGGSW